jgi:oligopeptide/dipeptide ABC transporter ATP-binding protein
MVNGLGKDYPVKAKSMFARPSVLRAVDSIHLQIQSGEILGLAGESGCGKSTLARMICCLEEPSHGQIEFQGQRMETLHGERLRKMRHEFQPVFQDPLGSLNPRFTVRQTLIEPLQLSGNTGAPEDLQKVLFRVGLGPELLERYPHQLSGGQRQRVGLARSLAMVPDLLVADEPLSSLDVSVQGQIINLILQLQKELRLAILFISHDLRVVGQLADRIAIMYLGRIMEQGPAELILSRPRHPYTQALFQALPKMKPGRGRKRALLSGELPTPINPKPGCRFYSRCMHKRPECLSYENELLLVEKEHTVACCRWQEIESQRVEI